MINFVIFLNSALLVYIVQNKMWDKIKNNKILWLQKCNRKFTIFLCLVCMSLECINIVWSFLHFLTHAFLFSSIELEWWEPPTLNEKILHNYCSGWVLGCQMELEVHTLLHPQKSINPTYKLYKYVCMIVCK